MSMVLRSRKTLLHPNQARGDELRSMSPVTRRRKSTRPHETFTYEEWDESDSESVCGRVMETQISEEEYTAEEAAGTELKYCSVVLDRLLVDDSAARKELEENEDMNRRGGKPVSRIPTFLKRPAGAGQTPEPAAPKKEAQPPGKAARGSKEASRAKPPDVRETVLPLPVVRVPHVGLEAPSLSGSAELASEPAARTPLTTAPKSWGSSEPAQYSLMTASPRPALRPALRPEYGSERCVPEQDQSKAFETEAAAAALDPPASRHPEVLDPPASRHPEVLDPPAPRHPEVLDPPAPRHPEVLDPPAPRHPEVLDPPAPRHPEVLDPPAPRHPEVLDPPAPRHPEVLDPPAPRHPAAVEQPQDPEEEYPEEEYGVEVRSTVTLNAAGDGKMPEPEDDLHKTEVSHGEEISDEQAPWETEPITTLKLKDSRSSSECESEEKFADEKSVEEERREPLAMSPAGDRAEERAKVPRSTFPVVSEMPAQARSARSTKSCRCSSFFLVCILPTALLLLGGLGQHVWHYGLPLSVAQLTAQLELHWLEGFVQEPCSTECRVQLVESIPEGLYRSPPSSRRSIADSWLRLLKKANSSVQIAAFYFSLQGGDSQGKLVFEQLKGLKSKGVKLQVAVNAPQTSREDTAELAAAGAEVREVDLMALTGGIVHTKLWVVDQKHFYLGSANMDWRSLSQVKEVGLSVENCSCLAQDASRLFGVYWSVGEAGNGSLPPYWPARLSALSSSQNPMRLKLNGVPAEVYLSSSPPQISARGRSDDLSTILSVIGDARSFIYISVMDYLPLSQYTEPQRFWPAIDSALRSVACTRGVRVRLLVSCWEHSPGPMFPFLQSLLALSKPQLKCDIDVKVFTVPSTAEQMKIPFARVNHAKYMVTDRVLYIGTSNWSENYFTHTAGAGLVVNQTGSVVQKGQETLQSQAEELFLRDWTSDYASRISLDDVDVCPRGAH